MSAKVISMFNHKGGVVKTTTIFHLGYMLASLGKKILLVDCDPQCNLTSLVIGEEGFEEYPFDKRSYTNPLNIRDSIAPPFENRPYAIAACEIQPVKGNGNLFLLPGHVGIAEYESQLSVAHEMSQTLGALLNLPGAIRYAIDAAASKGEIDIVLIDLSPSLGALNQNIIMTSDAFIIPMAPDLFSAMGIRSLAKILPKWAEWGRKASGSSILSEADYPFPDVNPVYLGSVVQNFRKRARDGGEAKPTKAFQAWFDSLNAAKLDSLIPALQNSGMLLRDEIYQECDALLGSFLMEIPNFDSLIAAAQDLGKPVFELNPVQDLGYTGNVLATNEIKIKDIRERYLLGANRVLKLAERV